MEQPIRNHNRIIDETIELPKFKKKKKKFDFVSKFDYGYKTSTKFRYLGPLLLRSVHFL